MPPIGNKKVAVTCLRVTFILLTLLLSGDLRAFAAEDRAKPWSIEAKVKRYFQSHTSYEFGSPIPPYQAPLSRLEFPLSMWWSGLEIRRRTSRTTIGFEFLRTVSRESDGTFMDSDWDDYGRPEVKTIYSESDCRMEPGYVISSDLDVNIADCLGLPSYLELRPLVGFRWQHFKLIGHDGKQFYPTEYEFSGDIIRFDQSYWQYFMGIRTVYDIKKHTGGIPIKLLCQLDWAHVYGKNSDYHILRRGNRWTYENTKGDAWHAIFGIKTALTENLSLGVDFEYLRIRTSGAHRLVNDYFDIDIEWSHGVKVWSEQKNIMLKLEYLF